jgi:hypothetical protein
MFQSPPSADGILAEEIFGWRGWEWQFPTHEDEVREAALPRIGTANYDVQLLVLQYANAFAFI